MLKPKSTQSPSTFDVKVSFGLEDVPAEFNLRQKVSKLDGARLERIRARTGAHVALVWCSSGVSEDPFIEISCQMVGFPRHSSQAKTLKRRNPFRHHDLLALQNARQMAECLVEFIRQDFEKFQEEQRVQAEKGNLQTSRWSTSISTPGQSSDLTRIYEENSLSARDFPSPRQAPAGSSSERTVQRFIASENNGESSKAAFQSPHRQVADNSFQSCSLSSGLDILKNSYTTEETESDYPRGGPSSYVKSLTYHLTSVPAPLKNYVLEELFLKQFEITTITGASVSIKGNISSQSGNNADSQGKNSTYILIQGLSNRAINAGVELIEEVIQKIKDEKKVKVAKVAVGIQSAPPEFDLVSRVSGADGANLRLIADKSGASVMLKGRGSSLLDAFSWRESSQPLHLMLEHTDVKLLELAKNLAMDLVKDIQNLYLVYCSGLKELTASNNSGSQERLNPSISGSKNTLISRSSPPMASNVPPGKFLPTQTFASRRPKSNIPNVLAPVVKDTLPAKLPITPAKSSLKTDKNRPNLLVVPTMPINIGGLKVTEPTPSHAAETKRPNLKRIGEADEGSYKQFKPSEATKLSSERVKVASTQENRYNPFKSSLASSNASDVRPGTSASTSHFKLYEPEADLHKAVLSLQQKGESGDNMGEIRQKKVEVKTFSEAMKRLHEESMQIQSESLSATEDSTSDEDTSWFSLEFTKQLTTPNFTFKSNRGTIKVIESPRGFECLYASVATRLFGPFRSLSELDLSALTLHHRAVDFIKKNKASYFHQVTSLFNQIFKDQATEPEMAFESGCTYLFESHQIPFDGQKILLHAIATLFNVKIIVYEEVSLLNGCMDLSPNTTEILSVNCITDEPICVLKREYPKHHYDSLLFQKSKTYHTNSDSIKDNLKLKVNDCKPPPSNYVCESFKIATWQLNNCHNLNICEAVDTNLSLQRVHFACVQGYNASQLGFVSVNYNWWISKEEDNSFVAFLLKKSCKASLENFTVHTQGLISAEVLIKNQSFPVVGCFHSGTEEILYYQILNQVVDNYPPTAEIFLLGNFQALVPFQNFPKDKFHLANLGIELQGITNSKGSFLMDIALKHDLNFLTMKSSEDGYATFRVRDGMFKISSKTKRAFSHILFRNLNSRQVRNFRFWVESISMHAIVVCSIEGLVV